MRFNYYKLLLLTVYILNCESTRNGADDLASAVIGQQLHEKEIALINIRTECEKLFNGFPSISTDELSSEEELVFHLCYITADVCVRATINNNLSTLI